MTRRRGRENSLESQSRKKEDVFEEFRKVKQGQKVEKCRMFLRNIEGNIFSRFHVFIKGDIEYHGLIKLLQKEKGTGLNQSLPFSLFLGLLSRSTQFPMFFHAKSFTSWLLMGFGLPFITEHMWLSVTLEENIWITDLNHIQQFRHYQ